MKAFSRRQAGWAFFEDRTCRPFISACSTPLPFSPRSGGIHRCPLADVRGANRDLWNRRPPGSTGAERAGALRPLPRRISPTLPSLSGRTKGFPPHPCPAAPLRRRCAVAAPAGSRRSAPDVAAGGRCGNRRPAFRTQIPQPPNMHRILPPHHSSKRYERTIRRHQIPRGLA
jgi:hypothetical protein